MMIGNPLWAGMVGKKNTREETFAEKTLGFSKPFARLVLMACINADSKEQTALKNKLKHDLNPNMSSRCLD
jgi:hypothetical protein